MENFDENGITELENFDQFNDIDAAVAAVDFLSNKIIYLNKYAQKLFNVQTDYFNKKCFNVFERRNTMCPWCFGKGFDLKNFTDNFLHTFSFNDSVLNKKIVGNIRLCRYNGALIRLDIAIDIDLVDNIINDKTDDGNNIECNDSFSKNQISIFFDNAPFPVFIVNSKRIITYFNSAAIMLFPSLAIGERCSALGLSSCHCDNCYLKNAETKANIFDGAIGEIVTLVNKKIFYENQESIISIFEPLNDELNKKDKLLKDHISQSISAVADIYTEINLNTKNYVQYRYSSCDYITSQAIGDYDDANEKIINESIDPAYKEILLNTVSIDGLRRLSKIKKNHTCIYKLKNIDYWVKLFIVFIKENDATYACIYSIDDTNEILKDRDSLTGLLNRNAGKKYLEDFIKENPDGKYGFVLMDIDDFKEINDTYGHFNGDRCIISLSKMLKELPENYCYCSRLGGDEFCFAVKDLTSNFNDTTINVFLNDLLLKYLKEDKIKNPMYISCGTSRYPQNGKSFDELYVYADKQMYNRKKNKQQ
jgi:diguanylate cyclase (GGDEF)-like protein